MFLPVPAHPGSSRQRAVKRLLCCRFVFHHPFRMVKFVLMVLPLIHLNLETVLTSLDRGRYVVMQTP